MRKVAVVTDSTCCLPQEIVEKYDICVVPLEIVYEGKSYRDGIDMTPNEVYKIMRKKEIKTITFLLVENAIIQKAFKRMGFLKKDAKTINYYR